MTKNYKNEDERIELYQDVVTKATTDIWTHMVKRLEAVPDELTDLSEDHYDILMDVEAVESEWILDEDLRASVSLIAYADDDEDEA